MLIQKVPLQKSRVLRLFSPDYDYATLYYEVTIIYRKRKLEDEFCQYLTKSFKTRQYLTISCSQAIKKVYFLAKICKKMQKHALEDSK